MERKLSIRIFALLLCFVMTVAGVVSANVVDASAAKKVGIQTLIEDVDDDVSYTDEDGYEGLDDVDEVEVPSTETTKNTQGSKGNSVANYAKKFVGNPYRYGGTSLTRGADCSGFVKSVYRHFGYSLPHSSSAIATKGKRVSSPKVGDVICYYGHVAIYIGNGKIVHASSRKTGIKISNNYKYRAIRCIRRIL